METKRAVSKISSPYGLCMIHVFTVLKYCAGAGANRRLPLQTSKFRSSDPYPPKLSLKRMLVIYFSLLRELAGDTRERACEKIADRKYKLIYVIAAPVA